MEFHQKPSLSNLRLQMTLYFNGLFSLMFVAVIGACALHKVAFYRFELELQKYVLIPIVVVWAVGEAIRFHCGVSGNLKEKVPDLLTFLLVSVFPQLPIVIYLSFFQEILFPIDYLMGPSMLALMVIQIGLGYTTLRSLIQSQTAHFLRLCENEES